MFCPLKDYESFKCQHRPRSSSLVRFHPSERSNVERRGAAAATALPLDYPWSRTNRPCPCRPRQRAPRSFAAGARGKYATLWRALPSPSVGRSVGRTFQAALKEKISPNLTLPRAMPTCRHRSQRQLDTRTDRQTDGVAPSVRAYEGPTAFHVGWTLWTDKRRRLFMYSLRDVKSENNGKMLRLAAIRRNASRRAALHCHAAPRPQSHPRPAPHPP